MDIVHYGAFLLLCQILDPFALLQHPCTQGAFDEVCALTDHIQRQNANTGKPAQAECKGNTESPDKAAVKDEGDHGLTAGTQCEVSGIGIGVEGHHHSGNADQLGGQNPDGVGGVVHLGENSGEGSHQTAEEGACHHRGKNQFAVVVPDFRFRASGTQQLPHDDANGIGKNTSASSRNMKSTATMKLPW